MRSVATIHSGGEVRAWRATLSAACANLLGIGLQRFAYTPLIPALISAGWFTPLDAAYLGAANFVGYLIGALSGQTMAARYSSATIVRIMMVIGAGSFIACATPNAFPWFFFWRFVSGWSGGVVMVVAAPAALQHVPASRRGLAGGFIFSAIGLGIVVSGGLVPLLLGFGLTATWCSLGLLAFLLTVVAWNGWARASNAAPGTMAEHAGHESKPNTALRYLYVEYVLAAVALVPHMLFLVDFIARGLGQGIDVGGRYWVLFGAGAMVGPLLSGYLADRIGFGPALRWGLLLQIVSAGSMAFGADPAVLILSSFFVGAFVPGVAALVLGRIRELLPHDAANQKAAWSRCTAAFAVGQAVAGYGFSFIFGRTEGDYAALFVIGSACAAIALALDLGVSMACRRAQAGSRP